MGTAPSLDSSSGESDSDSDGPNCITCCCYQSEEEELSSDDEDYEEVILGTSEEEEELRLLKEEAFQFFLGLKGAPPSSRPDTRVGWSEQQQQLSARIDAYSRGRREDGGTSEGVAGGGKGGTGNDGLLAEVLQEIKTQKRQIAELCARFDAMGK